MLIEIYTKESCPFCDRLKELLQAMNLEYTEKTLFTDFSKEEFKEQFQQPHTFPKVFVDGKLVGGYTDFVHYAKDNL